ncbi:MAG: adenosylcobinamide-phosphate synthase CbiB [Candidatus Omnitrophota bacterium]
MLSLSIIAAYILDLIFGDPRWFPHPVKIIGWFAKKLETLLINETFNKRISGVLFLFIIVFSVFFVTFCIVKIAESVNLYLGMAISAIFIYTSLSVKDLRLESMKVFEKLRVDDLPSTRQKLSLIVGRDTASLDRREIIRATIETVAESVVDGIISPLFFAFAGGAPLAMAYKAVNTLDSMVGYKNERYKDFGWASAKVDDFVNFIPARIAGLLLPVAGWLSGFNGLKSWHIVLRDGAKNPSPNSGIPEAAVAGALEIRLGGLNFYNSLPVFKPFIGDKLQLLDVKHIEDSIKIAYVSSGLFVTTGIFLLWLTGRR